MGFQATSILPEEYLCPWETWSCSPLCSSLPCNGQIFVWPQGHELHIPETEPFGSFLSRITATVYPQIWFWCQFTEKNKKKKKSRASHQSQNEYESTVPCCCEAGRRWMKLCKHECILHGRCRQPLLFLELLRAQRGCLVGTMSRGTWTCPSQARREQRGVWKRGQAGTAKRFRLAKDDWGRMWCQPAGRWKASAKKDSVGLHVPRGYGENSAEQHGKEASLHTLGEHC